MKKISTGLVAALILSLCALPALADVPGRTQNIIGTVIISNADSARVRADSNAESEQIGLVNPGEQYDCVGTAANGWYEIVYPTGQNGFISNKLAVIVTGTLSDSTFSYPIGTVDITHGGDVRTHNGGGEEYSFMGSVKPGTSYPCVGVSATGWYAIVLDNGWIVYVSNELTRLNATTNYTPNPIPQSASLAGITVQGIVTITNDKFVNVRTAGNEEAPVITHAQPGDIYSYVGKPDGSSWPGILLPDGQIGYVAPGLVEVTKKQ